MDTDNQKERFYPRSNPGLISNCAKTGYPILLNVVETILN